MASQIGQNLNRNSTNVANAGSGFSNRWSMANWHLWKRPGRVRARTTTDNDDWQTSRWKGGGYKWTQTRRKNFYSLFRKNG